MLQNSTHVYAGLSSTVVPGQQDRRHEALAVEIFRGPGGGGGFGNLERERESYV